MAHHALRSRGHASPEEQTPELADFVALVRPLFGNSSDGVIVVDATACCVAANRVAERLLGYADDDWPSLALSDVLVEATDGMVAPGKSRSESAIARRKAGTLARWTCGVPRSPNLAPPGS